MQTEMMDSKHAPLTSLVKPSLSHNSDFIHAGAEHSLDWEGGGAADKLVEIVQNSSYWSGGQQWFQFKEKDHIM